MPGELCRQPDVNAVAEFVLDDGSNFAGVAAGKAGLEEIDAPSVKECVAFAVDLDKRRDLCVEIGKIR